MTEIELEMENDTELRIECEQDVYKRQAKSIPTDFATAGSAVGEVNTRFHMTGQELEDLSQQFVEFASLNDTDVSSSIDNTQKVMEAFNLKSKDAGALLDTMNKVCLLYTSTAHMDLR